MSRSGPSGPLLPSSPPRTAPSPAHGLHSQATGWPASVSPGRLQKPWPYNSRRQPALLRVHRGDRTNDGVCRLHPEALTGPAGPTLLRYRERLQIPACTAVPALPPLPCAFGQLLPPPGLSFLFQGRK